ncbi:TPA: hypothetical protein VDU83_002767 [Pseudomonas aeruginosa]|nr:hypothetical protein [Pseudomonas aeruginosa]
MTLRNVQFFTEETEVPGVYLVSFSGDSRFYNWLEVHLSRPLGKNALDCVELYGIWFFLIFLEAAGNYRTARNFGVTVSRPSVRKHLLETVESSDIAPHANAARTILYGIDKIGLDQRPGWVSRAKEEGGIAVQWDGDPCPYQTVPNERFGALGITYHAVDQYFNRTRREGRQDQMLSKLQKLARAATHEVELPKDVQFRKILTHGFEQKYIKTLAAPRGWMLVTAPDNKRGYLRVISVYQSNIG